MDKNKKKLIGRISRHKRIRAKISGNSDRPRLNIFKSNLNVYLQIINDESGKTIVSAQGKELKSKKLNKTEQASALGKLIAEKALKKDIKKVVFDKGGYKYHGRVKAAAEAARAGGLEF